MNKNFFAGLAVGLGLFAVLAFRPAVEKPAAQKWEYMLISSTNLKFQDKINEAGAQGWELAAVGGPQMIFKRPLE